MKYNLAAQSHVAVSFENPEYISNVNARNIKNIESIRLLNLQSKCKFYQASTSEMFGDFNNKKLDEESNFMQSPYGVSKLYAH